MSLQVRDPRSRGRSKSPGGRDRDRSRSTDARAPAPEPPREKSRKSSKKYYDDGSEEEERKVKYIESKPSKKHYDDSDSDERHRKPSKKHDDSDSEDRKPKKSSSKKYYGPDSEEEEERHRRKASYQPDSDESPGHRPSTKKSSKKYADSDSEDDDPRYQTIKPRASSPPHAPQPPGAFPSTHSPPHPSHHPSYSQPDQYKHGDARDYTGSRHMSYAKTQPDPWADVPECERPGFVPPPGHPYAGTQHVASPTSPRGSGQSLNQYAAPASPRGSGQNLALNTAGIDSRIGGQRSPRPSFSSPTQPQYASPTQHQYPQQPPYGQQQPSHFQQPPHGQSPPYPYGPPHTDVPDHQRVHSISGPPGQAPGQNYAIPNKYEYAQPDPNVKYSSKSDRKYSQAPDPQFDRQAVGKGYTQTPQAQYTEIRPGGKHAPSSPNLAPRMHSLSVSGAAAGLGGLTVATQGLGHGPKPPGSPLLEAYRGTYQSISPMPSPMMLGHKDDSDLSDLELERLSDDSRHGKKKKHSKHGKDEKHDKHDRHDRRDSHDKHDKHDDRVTIISPSSARPGRKRVSFYDPTADAKALAAALGARTPDAGPLIKILPHLSTDDILALRAEYKNHAKMGGKGINIAKHIKLKVPGNLGKVAYATALGRWESEAHWANTWYQGGASRRELLIESLMGRSNSDIREIKAAFSDKRYSDSLEKCMKAELKADKFRTAILLALEEKRQSDSGPLSLDLVRRDIADFHRALTSREGGETALINIIVVRNDNHLKEVMRGYEATYKQNFAREMIGKSRNLVGETLAHILNGALNRPMRDALLLHQAISESTGKDRAELLISRLVRLHWEPKHLERVKLEYVKRYKQEVDEDIERTVGDSDWAKFCIEIVEGD